MNSILKIVIFLVLLTPIREAYSQISLRPSHTKILHENHVLIHPLAGGINSAQYHEIDLDQDDDMDLVLFDRTSDKLTCFENSGGKYIYNPAFENLFPEGLQNWVVLKDYDCDGQNDLFTSSQVGIKVYRNSTSNDGLTWELVADPLLTNLSSNPVNIFLNATDIPSIEDLDGDGDLDILVFEFTTGVSIIHHQNLSIEETGHCDLIYTKASDNYGDIHVCNCGDVVFGEDCSAGKRVLHVGAKALLSMDPNQDGVMDIVISEEDCNDLSFLPNTGSLNSPLFESFTTKFPLNTSSIDFTTFPVAYYLDVTMDGMKDILVSSNVRSNTAKTIDFQSSSMLFETHENGSFNVSTPFLQDEMIDVGEWAYPAIVDVDGDQRDDLIIGNRGRLLDGKFVSTLTYYHTQSDGSLTLESSDLFNFSSLEHTDIKPQFVDINQDGKQDLVFTSIDPNVRNKIHYVLNSSQSKSLLFDPNQLVEIDLSYNSGDDVWLYDMDDDGHLDALIGRTYGDLDYFRNHGDFTFELEEGNILTSENTSPGNLSITIEDVDEDQKDDLIVTDRSGRLSIYPDFPANRSISNQELFDFSSNGTFTTSRFGRYSKPAFGKLGTTSLVVGSIQGGIWLYESSKAEKKKLNLTVYPNPSGIDKKVRFLANQSATLYLLTASGHLVLKDIDITGNEALELDLSFLRSGLYIAYIRKGSKVSSKKIVLN
ncbi:T9SS type A sorting domain-containing protein [Reichenbachiella agarivorans]|uniref:T9SS type A sorting domain-containing protein n=1 Tax=Reichenbachiella agarivorans TaxID=2979464 RepID=A0ABY6CRU5_9BACT|nr:T9SS type A sorting domain-containing protein [Reichenbachiella agarivorans]UXP33234.1 T9SS type A sorting domain-containing protein [Reichenbachiella agarivorans]